jgi:hypothetical protein
LGVGGGGEYPDGVGVGPRRHTRCALED